MNPEFMHEALGLARQGRALTSPNPMVGAVVALRKRGCARQRKRRSEHHGGEFESHDPFPCTTVVKQLMWSNNRAKRDRSTHGCNDGRDRSG